MNAEHHNPNGVATGKKANPCRNRCQSFIFTSSSPPKTAVPFFATRRFASRCTRIWERFLNGSIVPHPRRWRGGPRSHLVSFRQGIALEDLLRDIKRDSSKWIKKENPQLAEFHWQAGYGAFSISPSHIAGLKEYIRTQEEHHRHETFQDEFRRLCRKYGLEIDERYVWD